MHTSDTSNISGAGCTVYFEYCIDVMVHVQQFVTNNDKFYSNLE